MSRYPRSRAVSLRWKAGKGPARPPSLSLLAEALAKRGLAVLRTREPGGSPGAELLRGVLLGGSIDWSPRAETLLHFAARAEHVAKTIQPALDAGTWVICDRFFDSTLAYQGYGQGADRTFIAEQIRLLGMTPDLTLVLDVPECCRSRAKASSVAATPTGTSGWTRPSTPACDRVSAISPPAEPERCVLLDASGDIQSVHTAIMTAVWTQLGSPLPSWSA